MNYKDTFYANHFYHIYNRGNGRERIYFNDENYRYFLRKLDFYVCEFLDVYAYCLLPNHFHLLVRIKDLQDNGLHHLIREKFRRLFITYSQAINKQEARNGSLFQKPFKRKRIQTDAYLTQVIYYIHKNPAHHQITRDFEHYHWSSYRKILDPTHSKLKKEEVLTWFGGVEQYRNYHQKKMALEDIQGCIIEEAD